MVPRKTDHMGSGVVKKSENLSDEYTHETARFFISFIPCNVKTFFFFSPVFVLDFSYCLHTKLKFDTGPTFLCPPDPASIRTKYMSGNI